MALETAPSSCRQTPSAGFDIRWIGPSDVRDLRALDRWCAAVGPAAAQGLSNDEAGVVDALTIVSWNIHVGGGDVDALVDRLRRGELTSGEPVAHFALLLQEAYRAGDGVPVHVDRGAKVPRQIIERPLNGERRDIAAIAAALDLAYVYAPSMRNGSADEDRGNAILSTLPLQQTVAIELPFEHQRRVAIASTIHGHTSGGAVWSLTLADAHLDTAWALTRGGPTAARRRQADALIDALTLAGASSTIVAGDFNTWLGDDEPAIRRLRGAFPDAPPLRGQATWSAGVIGATLDFVFARTSRGAITVRRLPERFGSDHYPLLAQIKF
jgi:endonuclease/exonuclease/phosphatase family metal-dependent hydrolase